MCFVIRLTAIHASDAPVCDDHNNGERQTYRKADGCIEAKDG